MTQSLTNNQQKASLGQYLFRPFELVAGGRSLIYGLIVLLLTGGLASLANVRFDGVMDLHMPLDANTATSVFFLEQLINWLSLSGMLLIFGFLFAKSFRVVDLLGTQALARAPMLVTAFLSVILPISDVNRYIAGKVNQLIGQELLDVGAVEQVSTFEIVLFGVFMLIALFMLIWMIYLMYRSFSISCNISGPKAVLLFIFGLLAAEAISKLVLFYLIPESMT